MERFTEIRLLIASGIASLFFSQHSLGTVVVMTEIRSHNSPDNVGHGSIITPPFTTIPNLSSSDWADSNAGHGATVTMVDGVLNYDSGPPSRLNNGFWEATSDSPGNSTFFSNFNMGKFLFNLNGLVSVTAVNSYSRHRDGRTPQFYTLYGTSQIAPPATTGNLPANGWQNLTTVNMRADFATFNGVAGAHIKNDSGSLGDFRYLLFDIHGVGSDGGFGTFYGEIDVVGTMAVPESEFVLAGPALLGLAYLRRRLRVS